MVVYEALLLSVQASRDEHWELHLPALDKMVPYFFPHDRLNYTRHTPLYLATMTESKTKDIDSWN